MLTELRAALVLSLALLFFLMIIGWCALGMALKPGRWCERPRAANELP